MTISPIARFHSPFPTKFGIPRQAGLVDGLRGSVVFEPEFRSADAVRGLEDFDYLWLIWEFSENSGEYSFKPTVRPPRLGGNERVGVFASRSPFRPNSLGLSSVRIESIEFDAEDADGRPIGPVINVLGADLMDGTPIYDVKPYVTYADSHPGARSGFVDEREWQPLKVVFPEEEGYSLNISALREVLSQDPRPQYHNDPDKIYGMKFDGCEIRFKVSSDVLTVTSIKKDAGEGR